MTLLILTLLFLLLPYVCSSSQELGLGNRTKEFVEIKAVIHATDIALTILILFTCLVLFISTLVQCKTLPIKVHNVVFLCSKLFVTSLLAICFFLLNACPRYFVDICYTAGNLLYLALAVYGPFIFTAPIIIKFWTIINMFILNVKQRQFVSTGKVNTRVFSVIKIGILKLVPICYILFFTIFIFLYGVMSGVVSIWTSPIPVAFGFSGASTIFYVLIILIFTIIIAAMRVKAPFAMIFMTVASALITLVSAAWILYGAIFADEALFAYIISFFSNTGLLVTLEVEICLAVGLPLLQSFFWKQKQNNRTSTEIAQETTELSQLLNNPLGHKLFNQFAIAEWSSENLSFYIAFHRLKSTPQPMEKQIEIMKGELYNHYIVSNAPLCLNIDAQTSHQVHQTVQKYLHNPTLSSIELECIDLLQAYEKVLKQVNLCMCDTLSRFKLTNAYKDWNQKNQSVLETFSELGWQYQ